MENKTDIDNEFREAWKSPHATVPEEQVQRSWDELVPKLKLRPRPPKKRNYRSLVSIAASILLLVGGVIYFNTKNPTITIMNTSLADKELRLSDGSLVLLKQGGELTYKKYFAQERLVHLKGDAFFKVAKDSLREFSVISGNSTIKVLGTSFLVRGKENNDTEVSLYTGRVSVSIKGIAESWGLIPGERFVYNDGEARIQNINVQLSFDTGRKYLDIEAMKMEDLIPFIQERFGHVFAEGTYDPEKHVTMRINKSDSLGQVLKILSIINNRTYEINEETNQIVTIK